MVLTCLPTGSSDGYSGQSVRAVPPFDRLWSNGKADKPFVLRGLHKALACPELAVGQRHELARQPDLQDDFKRFA